MRIRTNIFIWVLFATVLPLTALALGATYFSERTYEQEVRREVLTSLTNLSRELERHLQANQELATGMARAPAVQGFIPVLGAIRDNQILPDTTILRARVNHYFEGFQTILPGSFYLRILDYQGNTLIKVSNSGRSLPSFESLSGLSYVEQELAAPQFVNLLRQLPDEEASAVVLPHNRFNEALQHSYPLLDYVVPLYQDEQWVGAMTVTLIGEQLDRILDNAARLYKGQLFVVENNPDELQRHGQILYAMEHDIRLAQIRPQLTFAREKYNDLMLDAVLDSAEGVYYTQDHAYHNYYVEMTPYPNRLMSWIVTSRVAAESIAAPFARIRMGIILFGLGALVITLLLTDIGARKIARPVCQLAGRLKAYANGDHAQRAAEQPGIDEIAALASAFNYMADTLDKAEQERDRAQHMMLQSNKLASIGQMAAGIGHEINNPLNNILSFTKLISRTLHKQLEHCDEPTRQSLLRDLDSLRDEAIRASEIVRGILNFARQVPPQYAQFEVPAWLDNTLALVRQAARNKQLTFKVDCSYSGELQGDRAQLQQALINLLLNAIQASPDDATIEIDCHRLAEQLIIKIRDQGMGIARADLDRIFDPFFSTKAEGEGSGLGLSISHGIIEHHQGTLEISNNEDRGVTATVILPLQAHALPQAAGSL